MTSTSTPLLFLSGAGLPAWIWDGVRAALPDDRPTAVAEYPKGGNGSLEKYARKVLDDAPWPNFIVVAHSIGGVIGTESVTQDEARVKGFLGVAASVPAAGRSFVASLPLPNNLIISAVMKFAGTKPPEKAIRSGLANGLPEEDVVRIVREFVPESQRLYRDPVSERTFPALRGYIRTSDDRELPDKLQQQFATNLGATWTHTMPTGHLPMLTDPQSLTAALQQFLTHEGLPAEH